MKWTELRHAADLMEGKHVERDIWSLSNDPRFPALIAVLEDVRVTRLTAGSSVSAAADHGALAHAMGAVDAVDEVCRRLQSMVEPPPEEKAP